MNIGDILDKHYKENNLNISCYKIEKMYTIDKLDKYFKQVYKSYYTLEEVLYLYINLIININCKDCDDDVKGKLFEKMFINIKTRKCKDNMHLIAYIIKRIKLDKIDILRSSHPILGSAYRYYPLYLKLKEENKSDEEIMKEMGYGNLAYKNFLLAVQAVDICYLDSPISDGGSRDVGLGDYYSSKVFNSKYLEDEYHDNEDMKVLYEIINNLPKPEREFLELYIQTDDWVLVKERFNIIEERAKPMLISITSKVKREFLKRRGLY